jgi:hypothetical protein
MDTEAYPMSKTSACALRYDYAMSYRVGDKSDLDVDGYHGT